MKKFPKDNQEVRDFLQSLGKARTERYARACNGDPASALNLYMWNSRLSQAFYIPLQIWEVCLRNQMNRFLCKQFSDGAWPYNENRAVRRLKSIDRNRLLKARRRQGDLRGLKQAGTDAIVADLSAGFWVSMLSKAYEARFAWRYQLTRVFPDAPEDWRDPEAKTPQWNHHAAHQPCERLLNLRNRIAHHEPVFDLDLDRLSNDVIVTVSAMNKASANYLDAVSKIETVLSERP